MGKTIIKDDKLVEDCWSIDVLSPATSDVDDEITPAISAEQTGSRRVVSLAQWTQNRDEYVSLGSVKGVAISNDDDVLALAQDIEYLDLICVQFPEAGDGRGYSQAKLLRDRLGYQKEIRAIGQVLTDQLFLMRRSGINAFELRDGQDLEASLQRLAPFSVSYQ